MVVERVKMKRFFLALFCVLQLLNWQVVYSEAVTCVVPKQYLVDKASLVLLMLDDLGNQCVGTCQLDETFSHRVIGTNDLCIKQDEMLQDISNSDNITHVSQTCEHDVVLYFDLERELQVLRILVVRGNIFEDNPFNIYSIPLVKQNVTLDQDAVVSSDLDDVDDLTSLLSDIDISEAMQTEESLESNSRFKQYSLYVQIYLLIQYEHLRRKMNDIALWFYKN